MYPLVERAGVDQPVDQEEVRLVYNRHQQGEGEEIPRILGEAQPGYVVVGVGVEDGHLDGGPDRQPGPESAHHIVEVLALEEEYRALLILRELAEIFEAGALRSEHIKPQFEGAEEEEHGEAVHDEQL